MTKNDKSTRFFSRRQEDYISKLLGGKTVVNSGASRFVAGDCLIPDISMIIECKTSMTPKKSFSVKSEWISTNEYEKISQQLQYSALAISFTPEADTNYFIIGEKEMKKFVELLREENKNEEY